MAKAKIAIIGPGAVGQAMGLLLRRQRHAIAVAGSSRTSTKAGAVFIGGKVRIATKPATRAKAVLIITSVVKNFARIASTYPMVS